jgi:Tol biopolymer transport system component
MRRTATLLLAILTSFACAEVPTEPLDAAGAGPVLASGKQGTTSSRILLQRLGQVWIMNDDGSDLTQLTEIGTNDAPSWAPGGKRIVFAHFLAVPGASGIYSMDQDGTLLTQITVAPEGEQHWNPVAFGKRVAFLRIFPDGTSRIFSVNPDGSQMMALTPGPFDREFSGSPKGDVLAFAANTGQGGRDIFLLHVAKGGITQLTHTPTIYKSGVAFSPSGKQIAFTRSDPGFPEAIFVMNADGTRVTKISQGGFVDFLPRWSPGGTRIGFTSARNGFNGLFSMAADGSDVVPLTDPPAVFQMLWAWMRY